MFQELTNSCFLLPQDGVVAALTFLGLQASRLQSYNKDLDNVTAHDFGADALQWYQSGTQAMIMYGIGDWILNTIKLTKALYKDHNERIYFFTCSFMGTALNLGLQSAGARSLFFFILLMPLFFCV